MRRNDLYGGKVDSRTTEEILNGRKGGEYWEPSNHPDVDYWDVDSKVFEHLDALDHFLEEEAGKE